jgi:glycosyltransferase involved in cell wall biosynthesis
MLVLNRLEPSVSNFEEDVVRLGITPEFASESVELARVSMLPPPGGVPPADSASLPRRLGFRIAAIAAAIKRHRPTVVHGWLDDPGVAGALAGCSVGTPRVVIRLANMATRRISKTELLRQAYRVLARNPTVTILNNSIAGARDYEEWLGLPSRAITVLYNGFSPNLARMPDSDETAQFRASLGLSTGVAVVGTVMRFSAEKDPDLWLDTAAEIAKSRADVRFLIGGYGQLEQRIRKKIKSPRLRGRVVLAGPVIDVGLIYSAIDVVLLTSAVEGLPNVMIEAQAVGRPVVATDVGGTTEAVLEGQTGIIVRSRSAKNIAKAVITMLDDVDQRSRVRTEGPEFVACRFDLERMIDETLRHYELPRG